MLFGPDARLARKLAEAAVAVEGAKRRLAAAQKEYGRLYNEVVRRGRWNQKRREARASERV